MQAGLIVNLVVRGLQFWFAVVELGLGGSVLLSLASDYYYEYTWGSGAFAVCTALLTMAVVVFYVITTLIFKKSRVARPLVHAIMDSICWLFWLASFAAIAGTQDTLLWDFSYSEVYALIGLGVIEWLLFSASIVLSITVIVRRNRNDNENSQEKSIPVNAPYNGGSYAAPQQAEPYALNGYPQAPPTQAHSLSMAYPQQSPQQSV